jgi:hypothetical protein
MWITSRELAPLFDRPPIASNGCHAPLLLMRPSLQVSTAHQKPRPIATRLKTTQTIAASLVGCVTQIQVQLTQTQV